MKYDADEVRKVVTEGKKPVLWDFIKESNLYEKWMSMKQRILLRREEKSKKKNSAQSSESRDTHRIVKNIKGRIK
jgi:hypothetical protein